MKKTVQIVTTSLNKKGWNKDDLLLSIGGNFFDETLVLAGRDYDDMVDGHWQAQRLLVLSDDEIQVGDWVIHDNRILLNVLEFDVFSNTLYGYSNDGYIITHCKKVIASYPYIKGTQTISKETVQAWIDSGTPGDGSVEFKKTIENSIVEEWEKINVLKVDSQGNLLLKFSKTNIDRLPYPELVKEMSKYYKDIPIIEKPSIPTGEEIEDKARTFVKSGDYGDPDITQSIMAESYVSGYKQALKDLGY